MNYTNLSRKELLQKCEELNLTKYKSKTKLELISLLDTNLDNSSDNHQIDMLINKFYAPKITFIQNNLWRCVNVPCKIIDNNESYIKLLPFNSKSIINITKNYFIDNFYPLINDNLYVYTPHYPNEKIEIKEFDISPISLRNIKNYFKQQNNINILKLIEKAEQDSYHSKGNNFCITINNYNKFIENPYQNKLERIGDPIFNRSVRHSPPISKTFTREEYEKSNSFPAPIGIRYEDFALPSEQNKICIDLLNQIFNCVNAPICPDFIINELGLDIKPNTHKCFWCGELLDISSLNQNYCSDIHTINFCHRDPDIGTKLGNVYIGHCSCNREQGGYTELQRIEQIIKLARCNPDYKEYIRLNLFN